MSNPPGSALICYIPFLGEANQCEKCTMSVGGPAPLTALCVNTPWGLGVKSGRPEGM